MQQFSWPGFSDLGKGMGKRAGVPAQAFPSDDFSSQRQQSGQMVASESKEDLLFVQGLLPAVTSAAAEKEWIAASRIHFGMAYLRCAIIYVYAHQDQRHCIPDHEIR